MSLYNALFGMNVLSPLLLKILDIDQPDGKWSSGRFRDIYLNEDGTKIILYTRNGGGNREHWDFGYSEYGEGDTCPCPGCIITYRLPDHPNYLRDYDDDFDSTYAYVEFSVPDEYREELKNGAGKPETVSEKFKRLIDDLDSGKETEETKRALKVGEEVFGKIAKGERKIEV